MPSHSFDSPRLIKKPSVGRIFSTAALLWLCLHSLSALSQTVTEEAVVQRGLTRPAHEQLREGHRSHAEADAQAAERWDNPELSYELQQLFDANEGGGQHVVRVSQRFELSDARSHRAAAARAQMETEQYQIDQRLLDRETRLRERFYETLHAQQHVEALEDWERALGDALRIISTREEAGDVSRYERLRLESELARARGRIAEATITRDVEWTKLEALAGELASEDAPWPRVEGALLPPSGGARGANAGEGHPTLRALEAQERTAEHEADAAEAAWVPWLEVGAGYIYQGVGDLGMHGFVLSVSVPLTLVEHGQDDAQRAAAKLQIARSEQKILRERLNGALRAAELDAQRRLALAEAFQTELTRADDVVTMTEAGYAGGELRLSELIDAHRHRADLQLDALNLRRRARQAGLTLDQLHRLGGAQHD